MQASKKNIPELDSIMHLWRTNVPGALSSMENAERKNGFLQNGTHPSIYCQFTNFFFGIILQLVKRSYASLLPPRQTYIIGLCTKTSQKVLYDGRKKRKLLCKLMPYGSKRPLPTEKRCRSTGSGLNRLKTSTLSLHNGSSWKMKR